MRFPFATGERLILLVACLPLAAQVEKVTLATTGISCGVCAAVSEINFHRMPGVERVEISIAKESITIHYKPDAEFSPARIREILKPLDVGVLLFRITVKGRIEADGAKRVLIANERKYVLLNPPAAPLSSLIRVEAVLNDRANPNELRVINK